MTAAGDEPSVLIVDDEERVANTYELRLRDGYKTTVVHGGEEALDVVDDSFDVVLLDRRMPGTPGDEVLGEIRQRGLDCRVVMLTAVDPGFDVAEMDVDDYVVKPVDKDCLRNVVDRALTISEYNEQMQRLSSLKLKRNVLEVEMDRHRLKENPTYVELVEEIDALEAEIEATEETLDLEQVDLYL